MSEQACFTVWPKDVSALTISGQKLCPRNQRRTFDSDLFTFLAFLAHLWWGLMCPSLIHVGMLTGVVLFRWPYCWGFMGVTSLSCPEDTISQQSSHSSDSFKLSVVSSCACLGWVFRSRCPIGGWTLHSHLFSALRPVVILCNGPCSSSA